MNAAHCMYLLQTSTDVKVSIPPPMKVFTLNSHRKDSLLYKWGQLARLQDLGQPVCAVCCRHSVTARAADDLRLRVQHDPGPKRSKQVAFSSAAESDLLRQPSLVRRIMALAVPRCSCCSRRPAAPSAHQTLQEMDFHRGIWSAALDGDVERVRSFLNKGTDPGVTDQAGYTSLHYASRSGSESVCELLLSQKACPNPQTKGGATPLHRSAYCGHLRVVKLLLDSGADPLLCDDDGATPLHKAAEQGHKEVCELLIHHCSALKNLKNKRSQTPYQLVQEGSPLRDLLRPRDL